MKLKHKSKTFPEGLGISKERAMEINKKTVSAVIESLIDQSEQKTSSRTLIVESVMENVKPEGSAEYFLTGIYYSNAERMAIEGDK